MLYIEDTEDCKNSSTLKRIILQEYKAHNFNIDPEKDAYSYFASQAFGVPYADCCEFSDLNGTSNPAGKLRRTIVKYFFYSILCGELYSRFDLE